MAFVQLQNSKNLENKFRLDEYVYYDLWCETAVQLYVNK